MTTVACRLLLRQYYQKLYFTRKQLEYMIENVVVYLADSLR